MALLSVAVVAVTACATGAPDVIRDPPPGDLPLTEARRDVSAHVGKRVRWGGKIAAVDNRAKETWLDIVAQELDRYGRPRTTDRSLGRFRARMDGFLDPAVYAKSREVTVVGSVEGTVKRPIGEYEYNYVVVKAEAVHLWEPVVEQRPYYHDPFYDPFWPRPFYHPWYAPYPFYPYYR